MGELIIILVVALIIFGPRKLPELGRSLGKSLGEFRKASNELKSTLEEEIRVEEHKEQKAKLDAERDTAIDAASSHTASSWISDAQERTVPEAVETTPAPSDHQAEEPTISRSSTPPSGTA
jgi:TatA/E family protein of Tat protein translocase